MSRQALSRALVVVGITVSAGWMYAQMGSEPAGPSVVGGFATPLSGRTSSQRHNARLAAQAINGSVVLPDHVFSFNRTVQPWTFDRGYVKAPVSFEGELVAAFGGGVCQVSTTLYNAALLAGLPIVERHRHAVAPSYIPPGRDAAVAHNTLDLRFRNTLTSPIRIRARADDVAVRVELLCAQAPRHRVQVLSCAVGRRELRPLVAGPEDVVARSARSRPGPGVAGWRVITIRQFMSGPREVLRERVSDDTYTPVQRVIAPGTSDQP